MGGNRYVLATGRGTVHFYTDTTGCSTFSSVLYVPQLKGRFDFCWTIDKEQL